MAKKQYGWENSGTPERKERPANVSKQGDEFVQLELSTEQKRDLKVTYENIVTLSLAVDEMLEAGIKLTLKTDNRGNGYVAFAFADPDSDNAGFILTGRGGSSTRALRELVYKHVNILGGEWSQYRSRAADVGGDDW